MNQESCNWLKCVEYVKDREREISEWTKEISEEKSEERNVQKREEERVNKEK